MSKMRDYIEYIRQNPSVYIEELCGIKLFTLQKMIVDTMCKAKQISYRRNSYYKHQNYMSLCSAYLNMRDDAKIVISSPDGDKVMSKKEFGVWLVNEYWKR